MSYRTKPLKPGVPAKDDRVRHLMKLMSSGGYYGHKTCYELSEKWGVSFSSVKADVAEAGRFLRLDPKERDRRRQEMSAWANEVAERALNTPSKVTGLPDYKAALEAVRLAGIWQGISDKVDGDPAGTGGREPVKIEISYAVEAEADDEKSDA